MLKKIGVDAQPRVLEIARRAEMLASAKSPGWFSPIRKHHFRHRRHRLAAAAPEALAGPTGRGTEGTDFFKLMETARYTIDESARRELYYKAAEILHDDPPWLYLWQEFFLYGVSCRVAFAAGSTQ